jgi:hypothetical protein
VHGKENPRNFYATGFLSPTRAISPRQLPTDHDYAVSTREYQSDQPSRLPPRPLLALPSLPEEKKMQNHSAKVVDRFVHIRSSAAGQTGSGAKWLRCS